MADTSKRDCADANWEERIHVARSDPGCDLMLYDVRIRPYDPLDAAMMQRLPRAASVTASDTGIGRPESSEAGTQSWVAEWQGQIIGLAVLQFEGGTVARLVELALDPGWRGRHIARSLVRAAVERATDRGCLKLILDARLVLPRVTELLGHLGFRYAGDTSQCCKRPPQFYLDLYQKPSRRDGIAELIHEPQPDASIVPDTMPDGV